MKPIPKDFYQSNGSETMSNCKICNADLLSQELPFAFERAIKHFPEINASQIIFEIAICHNCAGENRKTMSKESLKDIKDFMTSEEVQSNMAKCLEESYFGEGDTLNYCLITGAPKQNINEYQIIAQCLGQNLLSGTEAFLISKKGIEIVHDLLSEETEDELDRFKRDHFGLPPEFENLLNPGDLVFI
tara:strand:- start:813 stop:1376 length:564 start_codon:yes stop_codon:yes gene_type:complete